MKHELKLCGPFLGQLLISRDAPFHSLHPVRLDADEEVPGAAEPQGKGV